MRIQNLAKVFSCGHDAVSYTRLILQTSLTGALLFVDEHIRI